MRRLIAATDVAAARGAFDSDICRFGATGHGCWLEDRRSAGTLPFRDPKFIIGNFRLLS